METEAIGEVLAAEKSRKKPRRSAAARSQRLARKLVAVRL